MKNMAMDSFSFFSFFLYIILILVIQHLNTLLEHVLLGLNVFNKMGYDNKRRESVCLYCKFDKSIKPLMSLLRCLPQNDKRGSSLCILKATGPWSGQVCNILQS